MGRFQVSFNAKMVGYDPIVNHVEVEAPFVGIRKPRNITLGAGLGEEQGGANDAVLVGPARFVQIVVVVVIASAVAISVIVVSIGDSIERGRCAPDRSGGWYAETRRAPRKPARALPATLCLYLTGGRR